MVDVRDNDRFWNEVPSFVDRFSPWEAIVLAEASPWGSFRHAGYYLPRNRVYGIGTDRFGHFGWLYESYGGQTDYSLEERARREMPLPALARYAIVLDPKILNTLVQEVPTVQVRGDGLSLDLGGRSGRGGGADVRVRPNVPARPGPRVTRGHLAHDPRPAGGQLAGRGPLGLVECDRDRSNGRAARSARPSPTTLASIWRTSTALAPARTASGSATRPGRARRRPRGRSVPRPFPPDDADSPGLDGESDGVADPPLIWRRAPRPRRAPRRLPDLPLDPEAVKPAEPEPLPPDAGSGPAPGLRDARRRGRLGAARSVGGAARRRVRCHRPVRPHGRPLPGSRASDGPSTNVALVVNRVRLPIRAAELHRPAAPG